MSFIFVLNSLFLERIESDKIRINWFRPLKVTRFENHTSIYSLLKSLDQKVAFDQSILGLLA